MAWTAPRTWVAGELVTASMGNVHWRDNQLELRSTPFNRCVAFHSTTQAIGGTGVLNLDSEDVDTASMHDLVTNNQRITIPSGGGGTYFVHGSTTVAGNGTLQLRVDASSVRTFTSASGIPTYHVVAVLALSAANYIDMFANYASTFGSASADAATRLTVIGPWPPS